MIKEEVYNIYKKYNNGIILRMKFNLFIKDDNIIKSIQLLKSFYESINENIDDEKIYDIIFKLSLKKKLKYYMIILNIMLIYLVQIIILKNLLN